MSYENSEADKSYTATEEDHEKQSKKKDLLGKKKDNKKGQKDQGYMKFDEEDSDESLVTSEDIKSPKAKKGKSFRFTAKKSKEKEEKKEKDVKKEEKDKDKKKDKHDKDEKDGKKLKIKTKKKSKAAQEPVVIPVKTEEEKPIFGVPLSLAVERNPSHDGIQLPRLFRECVDYIEEHGLSCEGIYRISGVKSKIQFLKDSYNRGLPVYLEEHEPNIIASLLKQFLRELPEAVLTKFLMARFEEASVVRGEMARVEAFKRLINELPVSNRLLLSWMIVHMTHVIEREKENKMSLQNVSIVLSPTMQISHRVLNVLFSSASKLFKGVELKKYKPPIKPTTSRWSLELPDKPAQIEEELFKQESLLNALHAELNSGVMDQEKAEQLWEVQRIVTQLKRKIKLAKKSVENMEKRKKEKEEARPPTVVEEDELNLDLRVREVPTKKHAPPPPVQQTNQQSQVESQEPISEKNEQRLSGNINDTAVLATAQQLETDGTKGDKSVESADEPSKEPEPEKPAGTDDEEKKEAEGDQKLELTADTPKDAVTMETANDVPVSSEEQVKMAEPSDDVSGEISEPKGDNQGEDTGDNRSSGYDAFEAQVEEILEKEKDMIKESSEESASDAVVTDQEDLPPKFEEKSLQREETLTAETIVEEASDIAVPDVRESTAVQELVDKEDIDVADEDEMIRLQEEDYALQLAEEELLAIESELRQKIETERSEIERLHQEIAETQYLRQDSDLEEFSSSSESSYESEDEDDLQEILGQLIRKNEELESKNTELCQKIHEERMICLEVKVQIRMLQHRQLENSLGAEAVLG